MSVLQYELMQTTNELSEENIKLLLDIARAFIAPLEQQQTTTGGADLIRKPRRLGSCKGVKFVADGYDIDDYNDEIEELFGVNG